MVLKLAFKVVIASTAVYWTNQLEVWTPLSEKKRAYDQAIGDAKKLIDQYRPEALKIELPAFVNQDLCATTNHYYNRGVLNTFDFLMNLPTACGNLYSKGVELLNAPPALPQNK